jgi:ElaB/YqjD/DUF883 family membrane-anchored ribosome-binding protein
MFLSLAAVGLFSMDLLYAKLGGFGCALVAAWLFRQVACAYAELHRAEHEQQMTALAEISQKLELQQVMTELEQNRSMQEEQDEACRQALAELSTSIETMLRQWQKDANAALQAQMDALLDDQKEMLENWKETNQAILAEFAENGRSFDASMQGAANNLAEEISCSQEMLTTSIQDFVNGCKDQTDDMQSIMGEIQTIADNVANDFDETAEGIRDAIQPLQESYKSFSETTDRLLAQMSQMSEEDNQLLRDLMKWSDAK